MIGISRLDFGRLFCYYGLGRNKNEFRNYLGKNIAKLIGKYKRLWEVFSIFRNLQKQKSTTYCGI